MSEVPLHRTTLGRQFLESTVPQLIQELSRLNRTLEVIASSLARRYDSDAEDEQR
jgi:hypothetical protein